jgi:hypothetical protein
MELLLVGLAVAGVGKAYQQFSDIQQIRSAEQKKRQDENKQPKDLYSAPIVPGRPVDQQNVTSRNPRDGSLKLDFYDPYTAWPSNRPGNPPKPRRKDIWRPREEVANRQDPELKYDEISGQRDLGRWNVLGRQRVKPSDLFDGEGNIAFTAATIDERPNQWEATWQSRLPASDMFGALNMQRRRVDKESGRCVENMRMPIGDRLFSAEPLGVVGTMGALTSTKRADDMIVLRTEKVPLIKQNFMSEGIAHGSDRLPDKSREYISARAPQSGSVFGQLGFVNPLVMINERITNKPREVDGRTPESNGSGISLGLRPDNLTNTLGDRDNRKDTSNAFQLRQAGQSYKVQSPYNFSTQNHAGNREHEEQRDQKSGIAALPLGRSVVAVPDTRQPPGRSGATADRVAGPTNVPDTLTDLKRKEALAGVSRPASWRLSRHE